MGASQQKIFLYGASGHAKVVLDAMEKQGMYKVICLFDDDPTLNQRKVFGYIVQGGRQQLLCFGEQFEIKVGFVAIGNNDVRARIAEWLRQAGYKLATVVHPAAQIGRGVSLGEGVVVMAGAVINSDTVVGDNVIINTGATIDHDCLIAAATHVAPGATLCGNVKIGEGSLIGAGSTIIPGVKIGKHVTVGAGSTVIRDIPDTMLVTGTPAKSV